VALPDIYIREAMNARAKNPELDGAATSVALIGLVRLTARQAAREWIAQQSERAQPLALTLPENSK
jgi:hypothetical protein